MSASGWDKAETASRLAELLEREKPLPSVLYVVGTPLGNMGDITPRALGILAQADLIAAEDTRRTAELLRYFSIHNELWSYHAHNERERGAQLLEKLGQGLSVALVTDAGMPAISDPGQLLVDLCLSRGFAVRAVPGPSAGITALAVSGLPSEDFRFWGFLPVKGRERSERLSALKANAGTNILYEAPHRLLKTLKELESAGLGARRAAAARELCKQYEEILRGSVSELYAHFKAEEPRGEFVLVLGPPGEDEKAEVLSEQASELDRLIREAIREGLSDKDMIERLGGDFDLSKNALKKRIRRQREGF